MTRERLPGRRQSVLLDLEHQGARYSLGIGFFETGKPGELFVSGARTGSDIDGMLADLGVLVSRLLQHGDTIEALRAGMGRLGDGTTPASIIGAVLDKTCGQVNGPPDDNKSPRQP